MKRSHLLVALTVLLTVVTVTVFAQGEPMANPECASADQLGDAPDQINQLYTDGQTALEDGDVRTWLDNLRAVSWLTSSLRAFCDGYVFEGDAEGSTSQVFGPITFVSGFYTVTATTDGNMLVHIDGISDSCGTLTMGFTEGEASEGSQDVFRVDEDDPCTALLEISHVSEDWRVEFSFVAAGD